MIRIVAPVLEVKAHLEAMLPEIQVHLSPYRLNFPESGGYAYILEIGRGQPTSPLLYDGESGFVKGEILLQVATVGKSNTDSFAQDLLQHHENMMNVLDTFIPPNASNMHIDDVAFTPNYEAGEMIEGSVASSFRILTL